MIFEKGATFKVAPCEAKAIRYNVASLRKHGEPVSSITEVQEVLTFQGQGACSTQINLVFFIK